MMGVISWRTGGVVRVGMWLLGYGIVELEPRFDGEDGGDGYLIFT